MGRRNSREDGRGVSKRLRLEGRKEGRLEGERGRGGDWKGGRLEEDGYGDLPLRCDIHFICNVPEKEVADMVPAMVSFIERCTEVSEFFRGNT